MRIRENYDGHSSLRTVRDTVQMSVLPELERQSGIRPRVALRDVPTENRSPLVLPTAAIEGKSAGKYRIDGELARGGVGVVFKGLDEDLGRSVAIKFLNDKYRDDPRLIERFVEEAQIGGQLQHPGIVPVYDLGLRDGRPYFAMKLIKGRTLCAMLGDRKSLRRDRRKFLAIFEQVCQTIAYAHARGVAHRDLKPANVMIGAFGEVQVVDWGLGKVLKNGGSADEERVARDSEMKVRELNELSEVATLRSAGTGGESVVGSVIGTPPYMPPEQAMGDIERMDERSDVFSLGAILCEILTGKPPYVGTREEVVVMAARGQLDAARERLESCTADRALVEIALDCLMPAPSARPRSARILAERVQRYLAAADTQIAAARIKAAELAACARTSRQRLRLFIGLLFVTLVGLSTTLFFWRQADVSARSEADARKAAEGSLDKFNQLSWVVELREAIAMERELYPAQPDKIEALRGWLENRAKPLIAALPALKERRDALRAEAKTRGGGAGGFRFPAGERDKEFLHDTLARLIADLQAFGVDRTGLVASVESRLRFAETIQARSIDSHRARWEQAAAELRADPRFVGVNLVPQLGLVPLGKDPRTGLQEFVHLRSAGVRSAAQSEAIPVRDLSGQLVLSEFSGLVFVLLPAGTSVMGSQRADPNAANYDLTNGQKEYRRDELLEPFFLSKFEMTQSQWAALSGGEKPSFYSAGKKYNAQPEINARHPVERVSWLACTELMRRNGLHLPSEAQWEYACRAGTANPWSTGRNKESLEGHANLADRHAKRFTPWPCETFLDDGWLTHSPVGTFKPNPFGFYDMHGNVAEWSSSSFGETTRTSRGGAFSHPASRVRSASRLPYGADTISPYLGLRPARLLVR